jgi:hypothetical protein
MTPVTISAWLMTPCLPSKGSQEIIRMMFEVQNGTVQSRNRPIAIGAGDKLEIAISAITAPYSVILYVITSGSLGICLFFRRSACGRSPIQGTLVAYRGQPAEVRASPCPGCGDPC